MAYASDVERAARERREVIAVWGFVAFFSVVLIALTIDALRIYG